MKFSHLFTGLMIASLFFSCKSDDNDGTGSLTITFDNKVGASDLVLNTGSYTNGSNEAYEVTTLKYIISNIVLTDTDGNTFEYPKEDSYFLINEANAGSQSITLTNVKADRYTSIKFGFGVDQSNYPLNGMQNFVPTAEEEDMLWSWSAGYQFIKFEGNYTPQGGTEGTFIMHVGSHGTNLDNYKEITLSLPSEARVSSSSTPTLSIEADIAKVLDGTHTISIENKDEIQVDPVNAPLIATNVTGMFTVTNVQ